MKYLVCLLMTLMAQTCLADSKADKVATLIRVKHQREYFQDWLDHSKADYEARANAFMAAQQAPFSSRPEFERQYEVIHARFVRTIEAPLTADAYIKVLSQYYGEHYSAAELEGLIRFYSTPLGQKERAVTHDADMKMELEFTGQGKAIDDAAMNDFLADYRKLSAKCGCLKKDHP